MNVLLTLSILSVSVLLYSMFKGFIKETFNNIIALSVILLFIAGLLTGLKDLFGI